MMGRRGGFTILLSFAVAIALMIVSLPSWIAWARPDWLALTLIYWCIALPHRIGIFSGFTAGLALDVIRGGLLGQYAAAYTVIAFLAIKLHRRMRHFPVWQQALTVFLILLLGQLTILWIKGMIDEPVPMLYYWIPSFTGLLVWPAVFIVLRSIRRNFHVQ
ncbi:MAG: rod shape-determining protein MreD [Thiotrichales bacterium]|nr:rod shape-determining protein MreD [Thiotrichales bacterium]